MEIGIRTSSLRDASGRFEPETLGAVRTAGFRIVEINFNHPDSGMDWRDPDLARGLSARARELEMRLVAHAPCVLSLSSSDPSVARRAARDHVDFLRRMPSFDVDHVVVHGCIGPEAPVVDAKLQMAHLIEGLGRVAVVAEEMGVRFSVETMVPGRLSSRVDALIEAVDAVGSDWIRICVDTNHSNLTEDVGEAIRRAGERLGELHFNDNHGEREEHLLPGRGVVDWEGVARAASAAPPHVFAVMEPNRSEAGTFPDWLEEASSVASWLASRLDSVGAVPE